MHRMRSDRLPGHHLPNIVTTNSRIPANKDGIPKRKRRAKARKQFSRTRSRKNGNSHPYNSRRSSHSGSRRLRVLTRCRLDRQLADATSQTVPVDRHRDGWTRHALKTDPGTRVAGPLSIPSLGGRTAIARESPLSAIAVATTGGPAADPGQNSQKRSAGPGRSRNAGTSGEQGQRPSKPFSRLTGFAISFA